MVENVDLIKGIFSHFNLDMRTHCKYSPPPAEDHEELEELPAEAPAEQVGEELEEPLEEIIENPEALPDEFIFEASVRIMMLFMQASRIWRVWMMDRRMTWRA